MTARILSCFLQYRRDNTKADEKWKEPLKITCVGKITAGGKIQIETSDGEITELEPKGYDHLK